ncbi:MAG TPA: HutP family protein [Synergistales bacterium]|nr:HutP family protein [Synergistales bacterium]
MNWKHIFNNENPENGTEGKVSSPQNETEGRDIPEVVRNEVTRSENRDLARGYDFTVNIHLEDDNQLGRAALLLAATSTPEEERLLKEQFASFKWKSVATEVGGLIGDLPQKLTRALVGASLNAGVIEKNRREMHALMHAAVEAMDGFISAGMLEASVGAKIGIVRSQRWISVAVMGDTAYHAVAHHERCGLGVMHL